MSVDAARLTLALPVCGPAAASGPGPLVELARHAEDLGVDAVAVADHVVLGPDTSAYPFGDFPLPQDAPFLEPLTVLTAVAMATSRIRLTTGILIAPLRPAPLLAKTVATLDVLSGGRVELGVGVGWHEAEYCASGVDFDGRGVALDHVIGACRALWSQPVATFRSATVGFSNVSSAPLPVQQPLPVLFAGSAHARNLERLATLGDGWITVMGASADVVAAGLARIDAARRDHDCDSAPFLVRSELAPVSDARGRPDVEATLAAAPALVQAGITDVQFPLPYFAADLDRAHRVLEDLVDGWPSVACIPSDIDPEVATA
jgi:probable F420-dependent oxidoreductase